MGAKLLTTGDAGGGADAGGGGAKARSREWRQGFAAGGTAAWLLAAALLALYARATAAIPPAEPLHSHFTAEANAIALRIFVVAAALGVIGFSLFFLWMRLRQTDV